MILLTREQIEIAEERIKPLQRRAERRGIASPSITYDRETTTPITYHGRRYPAHHVAIDIPHYEGWQLLAVVRWDHSEPVITRPPGEFHSLHVAPTNHCYHCHTRRSRATTYILQHDDGQQIEVGSTCIRDFLGTDPGSLVESMAALMGFIDELRGLDPDDLGGGRRSDHWDVPTIIDTTVAMIAQFGWTSRSKATYEIPPTSDRVEKVLAIGDRDFRPPVDAERQKATSVICWAKEISDDDAARSEYLRTLRTLARDGWCRTREISTVCSMVAAYDRARARATEAPSYASGFLGEVGDKIEFSGQLVSVYHSENMYGPSTIITFRSDSGHCATWFASGYHEHETNTSVRVKGRIKRTSQFRGVDQTVITRAKILV